MNLRLPKRHDYDLNKYDFLDLGSKKGGSIEYCIKRYSKNRLQKIKGLGIDIDPKHVIEAREAGFDVLEQDILKLDIKHKFKFVSALDFLEHLPSIKEAERIVKKMTELATDFLFIRHPSFEDIEYLKSLNLKITWTDWSGHTALMKTYDFANMFNKLGFRQYCFVYKRPILNSKSELIIPLQAPVNSHAYTKKMGEKKVINFEKPIYSQIDIFLALRPIELKEWNWISREDK